MIFSLIAPLDLKTLFINVFAGNTVLFVGIALLVIAALSAKFRMPAILFGMVLSLFAVSMMPWAPWLYFLAILFVGLTVFYTIARIVNR